MGVVARAAVLALGGWLLVAASPAAAQTAPDFGSTTQADLTFELNEAITDEVLPEATGTPAPTYTLNPASPFGLDFNAGTRTLSGTPTTIGTEAVTFTATNATGSDTLTFSITVEDPLSIGQLAGGTSQSLAVNDRVDLALPPATGGTPPYTYTLEQGAGSPHPSRRGCLDLASTPTTTASLAPRQA